MAVSSELKQHRLEVVILLAAGLGKHIQVVGGTSVGDICNARLLAESHRSG
jgi:hypothetical protein